MPIPFIIGGLAALAGVAGIGGAISGKEKMEKAERIMSVAETLHNLSVTQCNLAQELAQNALDGVGGLEHRFYTDMKLFKSTFEKIQQRPEFEGYKGKDLTLPRFTFEKLQEISFAAETIVGLAAGGGAGTLGGIAASGLTTTLVSSLGTASTGTAISSLTGAAATKATLAWLGGGAVSVGGGGVALGTAILGSASLGIGLLAGGLIFDAKADDALEKARQASKNASEASDKADKICKYFDSVSDSAKSFGASFYELYKQFDDRLKKLDTIVNVQGRVSWWQFYQNEKIMTQNLVWLVGLLYKMCDVKLLLKKGKDAEFSVSDNISYEDRAVNRSGINSALNEASQLKLKNESGISSATVR